MAFRRRNRDQKSDNVEIVANGQGLMVHGSSGAVSTFAAGLANAVGESSGQARRMAADGLAVAGGLGAQIKTHREYFEFSPRTAELLRKHGAIPTGDGHFHTFVRSPDGRIAGNLEWNNVDLNPEQALAFQTATAQLALRAATKDLAAAIERVEGKVDKLILLTRAERLGAALGDRVTLQALAEHSRERGTMSMTDWSTVDSLGALIPRDIAALCAYVQQEINELDSKAFVRTRSSELKKLTDDLLSESLELLLVVEQNYMLWQEIRIAQVATNEPAALAATVADARAQLDAVAMEDQWLIDSIQTAAAELLEPTGMEGFLPLERRRLRQRGEELNELIGWFAGQRQLDADELVARYPTLTESLSKVGDVAAERAKDVGGAIQSVVRRNQGHRESSPGSDEPDDDRDDS